jgi:MoxR-like ATPase
MSTPETGMVAAGAPPQGIAVPGVSIPTTASLLRPIDRVADQLRNCLVEREKEIQAILTAVVAKQHVLFVGQPGTAKSLVCRAFASCIDCRDFEVLLSKFSSPEELFGPVNISAMKEGRYERVVTGALPEAEIAFVDEFFKGSSAIQNTLLTAMNERRFKNGTDVLDIPLLTLVAASNEWPVGEGFMEAAAIFDRFLIRREVKPISSIRHRALIWSALPSPVQVATLADILQAQDDARRLPVSTEAMDAMEQIIAKLKVEGIVVGDRRMAHAKSAVKAACYLRGGVEVEAQDLQVLVDIFWTDPKEHPKKARKVIMEICNPQGERIIELQSAAEEAIAGVKDYAGGITASKKVEEILKELKKLEGQGNHSASESIRTIATLRMEMAKIHLGL